MTRRQDWMERLQTAVEDSRIVPFQYGLHDCCVWAAHCVDVMCGTHLVSKINERFNYANEEAAYAIIEQGGGLTALIDEFLPDCRVGPLWAAPGDVVLATNGDGREIVGIVVGHSIVSPSASGLITLPYANATQCWKV